MLNILLAGVGGQGTVLASKMLAGCAILRGEDAHTAETIGMAQRGGSVVSHVRIGAGCRSPLIPKGQADVIIAFEPAEGVRALPYLKKGGFMVVNSAPVKPITDSLSDKSYSAEAMLGYLKEKGVDVKIIDGAAIVAALGSAKSLNVALLGAAAAMGKAGCTTEEIENIIRTTLKPQFCEQNLRALLLGAEQAQ